MVSIPSIPSLFWNLYLSTSRQQFVVIQIDLSWRWSHKALSRGALQAYNVLTRNCEHWIEPNREHWIEPNRVQLLSSEDEALSGHYRPESQFQNSKAGHEEVGLQNSMNMSGQNSGLTLTASFEYPWPWKYPIADPLYLQAQLHLLQCPISRQAVMRPVVLYPERSRASLQPS